jgi:hypothetical protein
MSRNQYFWRMLVAVVLLLTGLVLVAQATLPRGWLLAGTKPSEYEVGVDVDQIVIVKIVFCVCIADCRRVPVRIQGRTDLFLLHGLL